MGEAIHWLSWLSLLLGVFFFVAGAIGLARFPDIHCRLHAVAKADTLGMGFLVVGFSLRADSWQPVATMVLIWALVAASSAITCLLLARYEAPEDSPVERQ